MRDIKEISPISKRYHLYLPISGSYHTELISMCCRSQTYLPIFGPCKGEYKARIWLISKRSHSYQRSLTHTCPYMADMNEI